MSYENAPSTQMLATHCAVCGKALRDPLSVEIGMGPDCRKKHGFNVEIDPDARAEANKIIHALSYHVGGQAPNPGYLPTAIARVRELGLDHLADVLADRLAPVKISRVDGPGRVGHAGPPEGRIAVRTPYSEEIVSALRKIPGRSWDRELKVNTFPDHPENKRTLWATIRKLFPGALVRLPDGELMIA